MIARRFFAVAILASPVSGALAAEIEVEDFGSMTRVTLPVSSSYRMRVKHPPQKVSVEIGAGNLSVTSPTLKDGGRVSALDIWTSEADSGIEIAFNCSCKSTSYLEGQDRLVIDIVEVVHKPHLRVSDPTVSAPYGHAAPATAVTRERNSPNSNNPDQRPSNSSSADSMRLAGVLVATPIPRTRPGKIPSPNDVDLAIAGIREAVENQMNDAASEGRITLTGSLKAAQSSQDAACPDESALDLRRLTDTTDFRGVLPGLRTAVLDDMKQVNPSAVRALARHFIGFGLGTEAQAVIASFGTTGKPETLILDMARYLDGQYDSLESSALFHKSCGRYAAVWRAGLAAIKGDGSVSAVYAETDGAVFDLPDALRMSLGAQIAIGLIDEGEWEPAMRLWRSLETLGEPETPEFRLLQVYALKNDSGEAVLPYLTRLAESRKPESIPAVLRATTILTEAFDREAAERVLNALDEILFVYRGSPSEPELVLARSKLSARYGDLASALDELDALHKGEPERKAYWQAMIQKTIRSAITGADPLVRPSDFAEILEAQRRLDQSPESDEVRIALARQLVDAGAAHVVTQVLSPQVFKRTPKARPILAEASVLMGQGKNAIALLQGAKDEQSTALRSRAMALNADEFRTVTNDRFKELPATLADAPLSQARQLIDQSDADLTLVQEMLQDG